MGIVVLIGRILFSMVPLIFGWTAHFAATDQTAGYAAARGLKGARAQVLLSGVLLIASGLSMLLGIWPDLGALLFFVFLLGSSFLIHHFWTDQDPEMRQNEMTQFMKDMALAGASLIAFAYFVRVGDDGPFQITGNLFDL